MKVSIKLLLPILGVCELVPVLFLLSASAALSQRQIIVDTPYDGAPSPNVYSSEPWSVRGMQSSRYQQVISASEFSTLGQQAGRINDFLLISDHEFGSGVQAQADIEILFGITTRAPDALSTVFAENFSVAPSVVHSRGVFRLTSAGGGSGASFILEQPFFYDPSQGNLLIEIRTYSLVNEDPFRAIGVLEAWNVQGDSVSRVYAHDVNATTGIADSMGITMGFNIFPVPEPSTFALVGLALGAWWWRHRRRQTKAAYL